MSLSKAEIVKRFLESAQAPANPGEAVRLAEQMGVSLHDIEEFLDYLDELHHQSGTTTPPVPGDEPPFQDGNSGGG